MNPDYYHQQCPTFKYEETEEGSDGMEVVRQEEEGTTPPFHHILNEQAKSLIALQELQNEVGALLEFREVVMEAFPQLRSKLRSGGGGNSSRWEPGVRVRRKARGPEEPRSRSNSRSSKAASSVVADSGFCTKPAEPSEDELWTLLELIQAKGTRLRLEAETLRTRSLPHQDNLQDRLQALVQERDRLLSRLSEVERESALRAEEASRLEERVAELSREKCRLESALAGAGTPRLGTLDGIVSSPGERIVCHSGVSPSREVTAAILKETSVLELQRHLITTSYKNQVAMKRLDRICRSRDGLTRQLEKCKEENDDLRFQLEEKSIELEGTRARVRLLERTQASVAADDGNSSTESAGQGSSSGETPKRPRSRIPLKAATVSSASSSSTSSSSTSSSSTSKPPRPPPLGPSQGRKPPPPPPHQPQENGLEHDSLECSRELDRSMRSEIVTERVVPRQQQQSSLPRPQKQQARGVKKKDDEDSLPQYFDSIDSASRLDSDSLDLV